jgi:mycothiol synthase
MDRVLTGLRPYAASDLDRLVNLVGVARAWPPATPPNPDDLLARWQRWHVNPEADINILPGPDGDPIAYSRASLVNDPTTRISLEIAVHPEWRNKGIGSALYRLIEERARNLKAPHLTTPVFLGAGESCPQTVSFLQHRGFFQDSSYWQMRIDNLAFQPAPEWPEGFTTRSFQNIEQDAERWADLVRIAFREPASGPRVIAQLNEPGASPNGYFFAVEEATGLEVGTSRGRIDISGGKPTGYVGTVGVLSEYRGRGLAQALIWQTIAYLRSQGAEAATLFVEGSNQRAHRLYEWMGWKPVYQTIHYWKNLSPQLWHYED